MASVQVYWLCGFLIYCIRPGGASYLTLEASGALSGVLVDGKSVRIGDLTTPGTVVAFDGTSVANRLAYRQGNPDDRTFNPAVLGESVVVCMDQIWFRERAPDWCRFAGFVAAGRCLQPFSTVCGPVQVSYSAVFSWSDDGAVLFHRRGSDGASGVISSTVALLILTIAESSPAMPAWALVDASGWATGAGILLGLGWPGGVALGTVFGICARVGYTNPRIASRALAGAALIIVAAAVPSAEIGGGPTTLLTVLAGLILCATAGQSGAVWLVPWAVVNGIGPLVWQSGAFDLRDEWVYVGVTSLLTVSAALLGSSGSLSLDNTWWAVVLRRQALKPNAVAPAPSSAAITRTMM